MRKLCHKGYPLSKLSEVWERPNRVVALSNEGNLSANCRALTARVFVRGTWNRDAHFHRNDASCLCSLMPCLARRGFQADQRSHLDRIAFTPIRSLSLFKKLDYYECPPFLPPPHPNFSSISWDGAALLFQSLSLSLHRRVLESGFSSCC
jgi:hypothetical protein